MFASLISNLPNIDFLIHYAWLLVVVAFEVWMFVDAIRRQEWFWAVFIVIGFFFGLGITAVFYFFLVYRAAAPSATRGFELPGLLGGGQIIDHGNGIGKEHRVTFQARGVAQGGG